MILEAIAGAYFSAASLYSLIFSLAGKCYKSQLKTQYAHNLHKFAILIPAYKEDNVIVSVAKKALLQQYDPAFFDVIVIADSLQPSTIALLKALPVQLLEVDFKKSTKVKALKVAMHTIRQDYDIALILDADNVMEDRFLSKLNAAYYSGDTIIQTRRIAKNLNTSFAILDAFSEIINNHIFRKGASAMGLSAPFIGSGMAFPFHLLKALLKEVHAVGGFDRELQVKIVALGHKIDYLEYATLLDEKVGQSDVFGNQRRRWLSSQFTYIRKFFKKGVKALLAGNVDLFNMAILNNIFLPRVMVLGLLGIFTVVSAAFSKTVSIPYYYWLGLLSVNILAILLAVPLQFYNKSFFMALLSVPRAFFVMSHSLLKLKGTNRDFIHTPHTS